MVCLSRMFLILCLKTAQRISDEARKKELKTAVNLVLLA